MKEWLVKEGVDIDSIEEYVKHSVSEEDVKVYEERNQDENFCSNEEML
jgi:hypothetical protein